MRFDSLPDTRSVEAHPATLRQTLPQGDETHHPARRFFFASSERSCLSRSK